MNETQIRLQVSLLITSKFDIILRGIWELVPYHLMRLAVLFVNFFGDLYYVSDFLQLVQFSPANNILQGC